MAPLILMIASIQLSHNQHDGVSNHQPRDCLANRLFRCRSKKASKLCVTDLCGGIHRWLVNSSHKGPVTRKMIPFDTVAMTIYIWYSIYACLSALHHWHFISLSHCQQRRHEGYGWIWVVAATYSTTTQPSLNRLLDFGARILRRINMSARPNIIGSYWKTVQ